jgi:hypothetical protein
MRDKDIKGIAESINKYIDPRMSQFESNLRDLCERVEILEDWKEECDRLKGSENQKTNSCRHGEGIIQNCGCHYTCDICGETVERHPEKYNLARVKNVCSKSTKKYSIEELKKELQEWMYEYSFTEGGRREGSTQSFLNWLDQK